MSGHIFQPLLDRAARDPGGLFAVVVKGAARDVVTQGAIVADAARLRARLDALKLEAGALAVIVLPHSRALYAAFIGCTLAGLVPSFLSPLTAKQDPGYFQRSMADLFGRVRPAVLITDPANAPTLPEGAHRTLLVDGDGPAAEAGTLPAGGGRTAFLQHTSGTTANKKGVMLSHDQVFAQAAAYAGAVDMRAGDIVASWLPLYHDMGLLTAFIIPAILGCPVVAMDAMEWVMRPTMLLDAIEEHRAAFAWLPNFAFHHTARAATDGRTRDLSSLKRITSSSEACRAVAFDAFLARFAASGVAPETLATSYAMAESVFALTQSADGPVRTGSQPHTAAYLSSGRPLPGVSLSIRAPDGAAAGALGEIWVQAPFLFSGYFRQPDVSAAKFQDGWFRTGDVGCIEDGELFVTGRIDDLININGRNVIAHEIEDDVGALPGIAPGRVLAFSEHDDSSGSTRLTLVAEPAEAEYSEKDIARAIRQAVHTATGVTPAIVRLAPRGFLVKSTSGKLARAESIAKVRAQPA